MAINDVQVELTDTDWRTVASQQATEIINLKALQLALTRKAQDLQNEVATLRGQLEPETLDEAEKTG